VVFGRLPGSKTGNGASPDRYFFGLPGNPVSTQVTFQCFVEPFLRVLAGAKWAGPHFVQAIFAEDVAAKPGLTRLLPARLETGREETRVSLISWNGSGDLAANARADCYAVLPPERQMKAGDIATVLLH
jgi:molybdopterin molybdotransferase